MSSSPLFVLFDASSELFRLCSLTLTIHCNDNNDDDSTEIASKTTTTHEQESVFKAVQNILIKYPHLIHSVNTKGQNLLQIVCSNATLVNYLPLMQLLIATSEYVTELVDDNAGSRNLILSACIKKISSKRPQISMFNLEENDATIRVAENDRSGKNTTTGGTYYHCLPTQARIVRAKSDVGGQTALHIACQNPLVTPRIIQYMIQCYPAGVCAFDLLQGNLPLHFLCMAAYDAVVGTGVIPALDIFSLLVQQYPESCQLPDRDGNLPLHLLVGGKYCTSENDIFCTQKQRKQHHHERSSSFFAILFSRYFLKAVVENYKDNAKDGGKEKNKEVSCAFKESGSESLVSDDSDTDETQDDSLGDEDDTTKKADEYSCKCESLKEILKHLIDVNPTAMALVNRHGYTPYEVARFASSKLHIRGPSASTKEVRRSITDFLISIPIMGSFEYIDLRDDGAYDSTNSDNSMIRLYV